jgi:hemolysin activation/secretion protein
MPSPRPMKPLLAALLIALPSLVAQAAGPVAPGGGTLLQEIQPVTPPSASPSVTGLTIEQEGGAKLPPSAPFLVKTFQITGNTRFDMLTLHALVANAEGKSLNLEQLGELAAHITDYYHSHGYLLSRAIIPAQVIRDGAVVIEVIEARFGKINLDNRSRVNDPLLEATLSSLQSGQSINQEGLDHALLLLSDIPGVEVNAILKPGEAVGSSDLLVETAPGPTVTGNVALDDYGNRYTGRARLGGTVNFIDSLHHGDILSVSGLSSGSAMDYGRVSYESLLNGQGVRMGGSYSGLHYMLGDMLSSLNAYGTAEVESLWIKHPFVRSRDLNLYGQIQYDGLQLRDHIGASGIQTDRNLINGTLSLAGDARDTLLSGGMNAWNVGLTSGHVGFDNSAAQLADAESARTQGGFLKWNANLTRLQSLSPKNGLYLAFTGQWSNTNLDPSQKMIAGGPYTVRAYDMGIISGDTGYLGTAEFRHDLGQALHGQWQVMTFIDSEHVTVNKRTWVAGVNSASLSGVGVGLNWAGQNQWSARAYIATPIGSTPAQVESNVSAHVWVEISRGF